MFEAYHQYMCAHCQIPIVGRSLAQLCNNLNEHNDQKHSYEPTQWSPLGISRSMHYLAPEMEDEDNSTTILNARPEYLVPRGTCQNSQKAIDPQFPRINAEDLEFLKEKKVKWL